MEEMLYFIAILIIGAFIIIPIILLINLSSANQKINNLQRQIFDINNKLSSLINTTADKKDIQAILRQLTKTETTALKGQEVVKEEEKITVTTTATPDIKPSKPITDLEPSAIIESTPKEVTQPDIKVTPKTETPVPPSYAASEQIKKEPTIKTLAERTASITPPTIETRTRTQEESFIKQTGKNIFEKILGDNWLSKVGIVTLVLGIGFFVKYAIDQNWINEISRVGIGLLTGGIIIALAHKLKEKYHVFSSILAGGGISIFYITITLAFREYEIFSQPVAFVILTVVTIFSIILSILYNRQELAIFSLIGGFCSPLMVSTGEGNYIVLFSFLLILNSGMLIVSIARNWKLIGIISYSLSLLFFWTWLILSFHDKFIGATIFASLFFIQFYLLAIIKHFKEDRKMTLFQAILILTNNLSALFALMYIFNGYEHDIRGLVTIIIAAINAIVMITLFRDVKVDKNLIYLIIGIVMSLVSLAIPIQLKGHVITMFWAAEMTLLVWLWKKAKIKVFYLGFLIISLLTIISYIMDINSYYYLGDFYKLPLFTNSIFITGAIVLIGFIASYILLNKEIKDSVADISGNNILNIKSIALVFKFAVIILAFLVPYLEFNYQLAVYTDISVSHSFRYVSMATYTTLFVTALSIIYRKKMSFPKYIFFLLTVITYAIVYSSLASDLRFDIFKYEEYSSGYFFMHLLSLPAILYIIYILTININSISAGLFKVMSWTLLILTVIILSVELDHIVIWLTSNPDTYFLRLRDSYTFGYPILWGLIAMALMIWGLKKKIVFLRKMALISFGLIIAKFYIYDVWRMSQTGRIVSFVVLGVILLVVSFMQQKIKTLVKDDEKSEQAELED